MKKNLCKKNIQIKTINTGSDSDLEDNKEIKIFLNEFKVEDSFQNDLMKHCIIKIGIETVSSHKDIKILGKMIENFIEKEALVSQNTAKQLISSYCISLAVEMNRINSGIRSESDLHI